MRTTEFWKQAGCTFTSFFFPKENSDYKSAGYHITWTTICARWTIFTQSFYCFSGWLPYWYPILLVVLTKKNQQIVEWLKRVVNYRNMRVVISVWDLYAKKSLTWPVGILNLHQLQIKLSQPLPFESFLQAKRPIYRYLKAEVHQPTHLSKW